MPISSGNTTCVVYPRELVRCGYFLLLHYGGVLVCSRCRRAVHPSSAAAHATSATDLHPFPLAEAVTAPDVVKAVAPYLARSNGACNPEAGQPCQPGCPNAAAADDTTTDDDDDDGVNELPFHVDPAGALDPDGLAPQHYPLHGVPLLSGGVQCGQCFRVYSSRASRINSTCATRCKAGLADAPAPCYQQVWQPSGRPTGFRVHDWAPRGRPADPVLAPGLAVPDPDGDDVMAALDLALRRLAVERRLERTAREMDKAFTQSDAWRTLHWDVAVQGHRAEIRLLAHPPRYLLTSRQAPTPYAVHTEVILREYVGRVLKAAVNAAASAVNVQHRKLLMTEHPDDGCVQ